MAVNPMRRLPLPLRCGSLALAILVVTCTSMLAAQAPAPSSSRESTPRAALGAVQVTVEGFRNDRGHALLAVFVGERGFPGETKHAVLRVQASIANARATFDLQDVPVGDLAISVLHDEDDDKKVKTGPFGMIPKEGLGFSRNPKIRFGPPDFEDAKLSLQNGGSLRTKIEVRYY